MKWSHLVPILAAIAAAPYLIDAQNRASTRVGVYSESQAARGATSYKAACASCHGPDLAGKGQTPPLAGSEFSAEWDGQPLGDLFERMQTTMPADRPGKLTRAENADILAYVLQYNKLPAGPADLPSDAAALKQIQFEAPKP